MASTDPHDLVVEAERQYRERSEELQRSKDEAKAKRQAAFQQAHDAGLSIRQIAAAVGLHPSRVDQVLKG